MIGAGEMMRLTKKKANMVSKKSSSSRDWGKVGGRGLGECCYPAPRMREAGVM